MKQATVRDLCFSFSRLERMLADGETIEITKRGRVVGRLVPVARDAPPLPDFAGRVAKIFGTNALKVSGAELVRWDRDQGY
jgi:antitoxin (DNA-binding transcriptional repressor) of toxin-antitoxin stability system